MRNKDLIKILQKEDPEANVVIRYWDVLAGGDRTVPLKSISSDEGIHNEDYDSWDCLTEWRDVKEMEDYYGASDSDPLAFMSVVVLS